MKTVRNLFVGAFMLSACIASAQQTETRKLSSFDKMDLSGPFDIILDKGSEESVKIIAENVPLNKIITEVSGKTLEIRLEKGEYRNVKGKIYVTYKDVDAINKSGSGNLTCNNDFTAGQFSLDFSGSGNISGKSIKAAHVKISKSGSGSIKLQGVDADDADFGMSGSGDVDINGGTAKTQTIHLSGSGSIRSNGMKSTECTASISGSGNIDVAVSGSLSGIISGSGNITYDGDPQVKKMSMSGSGRISKR
ncbi:MAG: head GIN domain-containing protein [Chitinophagaceae bacterium]